MSTPEESLQKPTKTYLQELLAITTGITGGETDQGGMRGDDEVEVAAVADTTGGDSVLGGSVREAGLAIVDRGAEVKNRAVGGRGGEAEIDIVGVGAGVGKGSVEEVGVEAGRDCRAEVRGTEETQEVAAEIGTAEVGVGVQKDRVAGAKAESDKCPILREEAKVKREQIMGEGKGVEVGKRVRRGLLVKLEVKILSKSIAVKKIMVGFWAGHPEVEMQVWKGFPKDAVEVGVEVKRGCRAEVRETEETQEVAAEKGTAVVGVGVQEDRVAGAKAESDKCPILEEEAEVKRE